MARQVQRRWVLGYALLLASCVTGFSGAVLVSSRGEEVQERMLEERREWTGLFAQYGQLSSAVRALEVHVAAPWRPGAAVSVEAMREAHQRLGAELNGVEQALSASEAWQPGGLGAVRAQLESVREHARAALVEGVAVVELLQQGQREQAARAGARADDALAALRHAMEELHRETASGRHEALGAWSDTRLSWRRIEWLLGGALLAVFVYAVAYGRRMVRTIYAWTVEKQAQVEALRDSEQRYRSVVDGVKEVIFQTDAQGAWTFLSPAWTDITGYTVEESLGRSALEFIHPEDLAHVHEQARSPASREKDCCRHQVRYVTRDGRVRWLETFARVTFDASGAFVGSAGTLDDVTERMETQRAMEQARNEAVAANNAKSSFLANMSHELRTPLNSVLGFARVLQGSAYGPLNERQQHFLATIIRSSEHMLSLVNDLLDLRRLEANRARLELEPLRVEDVLADAVGLTQPLVEERQHRLSVVVAAGVPAVIAERRSLLQVLINLLSNAAKYTPRGGAITLRARPAGSGVEFEVEDTGVGIAPEHHSRLFESFSQPGAKHDLELRGSGLGLALTKALVEAHGGTIGLRSEVGRGTTFHFTLPHTARHEAHPGARPQAPREAQHETEPAGSRVSTRDAAEAT
jgi:PAS domain S-box-containing protein